MLPLSFIQKLQLFFIPVLGNDMYGVKALQVVMCCSTNNTKVHEFIHESIFLCPLPDNRIATLMTKSPSCSLLICGCDDHFRLTCFCLHFCKKTVIVFIKYRTNHIKQFLKMSKI